MEKNKPKILKEFGSEKAFMSCLKKYDTIINREALKHLVLTGKLSIDEIPHFLKDCSIYIAAIRNARTNNNMKAILRIEEEIIVLKSSEFWAKEFINSKYIEECKCLIKERNMKNT